MAQEQPLPILNYLRRVFQARETDAVPDAQLLERFLQSKDEAAFELLMWRHGGMVLSLCRRLLDDEQDVEDAFQATFLTLMRKAGSIQRRQSLSSWLYKVAYRIALDARTMAGKRAAREVPLEDSADTSVVEPDDWAAQRELHAVLDEEIQRLPEKQRVPVILCYLQGRTNEEAARELGCSVGTIHSRLSRARQRLRGSLHRRGLALSAGALAALLAPQMVSAAAMPSALVNSTVQLAKEVMAGKALASVASANTVMLAEGMMKTMLLSKLKGHLLLLALVSLPIGLGAGILASPFGELVHGQKVAAPAMALKPDAPAKASEPDAPAKVRQSPAPDNRPVAEMLPPAQAAKGKMSSNVTKKEAEYEARRSDGRWDLPGRFRKARFVPDAKNWRPMPRRSNSWGRWGVDWREPPDDREIWWHEFSWLLSRDRFDTKYFNLRGNRP